MVMMLIPVLIVMLLLLLERMMLVMTELKVMHLPLLMVVVKLCVLAVMLPPMLIRMVLIVMLLPMCNEDNGDGGGTDYSNVYCGYALESNCQCVCKLLWLHHSCYCFLRLTLGWIRDSFQPS